MRVRFPLPAPNSISILSQFNISFGPVSLFYDLKEEVLAVTQWKKLISKSSIYDLCKINHKSSTGDINLVNARIERLYALADKMNSAYPDKVIKRELTRDTWRNALNEMHTHFPLTHANKDLFHLQNIATEYNDIIHWLESELLIIWPVAEMPTVNRFRICLDFNKGRMGKIFYQIDEQDFKHFSVDNGFGSLVLHYAHVGRHAAELFGAKDLICPKEQFVPQSRFTASCMMYFGFDHTEKRAKFIAEEWEKFYYARGGKDFFGYDFGDERIRFGALKIGSLSKVINNNEILEFNTEENKNQVRQLLLQNDLLEFKIID